jgi:hypothetical protein
MRRALRKSRQRAGPLRDSYAALPIARECPVETRGVTEQDRLSAPIATPGIRRFRYVK